jgi:hypothetical protein
MEPGVAGSDQEMRKYIAARHADKKTPGRAG